MTPTPGLYIAGPAISPGYLAGRRICVRRVLTWGDIVRRTGGRADIAETDDLLRRGLPMPTPRDPSVPVDIDAVTMIRGRVRRVLIPLSGWDGVRCG